MNDPAYQRLLELSWRRDLTDAETAELQSLLAAHPEAEADWQSEATLNRIIDGLPEAPAVSSNFTALVMQAIEREGKVRAPIKRAWSFSRWLPRVAVACVVLTVSLVAWRQHEASVRATMARDVAQLGAALAVSAPELTRDFEPIRRLSDSPKADTDLLALMQ